MDLISVISILILFMRKPGLIIGLKISFLKRTEAKWDGQPSFRCSAAGPGMTVRYVRAASIEWPGSRVIWPKILGLNLI
jgi:hypothetical protein